MKSAIILLIFFIPFCYASCSSNQIDINSASLASLDKLSGIGPAYAQRIIDGRPYTSIDELEKVKGIGPATLQKIVSQGLACISEETGPTIVEDSPDTALRTDLDTDTKPDDSSIENIINLNSGKVISNNIQKEEVIFESKNEKVKRFLIFAFTFFLILIILFLLLTR